MNVINIITCMVIAFSLTWLLRQIGHRKTLRAFNFRLWIGCITIPYLLKVLDRVNGDLPNLTDVIRDLGVAGFIISIIVFYKQETGIL